MRDAAAIGCHTVCRGARTVLLVALLGLVFAALAPGFGQLVPSDVDLCAVAVVPATTHPAAAGLAPEGPPSDGGLFDGSGGLGGSDGLAGSRGSEASDGSGTAARSEPGTGLDSFANDAPGCRAPRTFVVPGAGAGGHHGHHHGGRRICVASVCHHRSRWAPLGHPQAVGEAAAWPGELEARLSVPSAQRQVPKAHLASSVILRC